MPTVVKQTMSPRRVVKPSANGASILSQAIPVDEISDDFVKIALYGKNRTGKTTLACCFLKPLLLISFEPGVSGGAKSVKKVSGVDYLRITSTAQAIELARELRGDVRYKTHVIDTVTSCQDLVLQELLGLDGAPVQLNWGLVPEGVYTERSEKTREVLRPFRDLPAHTVFVAQEKDHSPPDGVRRNKTYQGARGGLQHESFFSIDLGGATAKWLKDSCDYVAQLYQDKEVKREKIVTKLAGGKTSERWEETETGRIVRRLRTMFHVNFDAGFRAERIPGGAAVVPEWIEAEEPEEMFAEVMRVIGGQRTAKGKYRDK